MTQIGFSSLRVDICYALCAGSRIGNWVLGELLQEQCAGSAVRNAVFNTTIEYERDEKRNEFVKTMVDYRVVRAPHFQKVFVIRPTVEMRRMQHCFKPNDTVCDTKNFTNRIVPFQLRSAERMADEPERLVVLGVVGVECQLIHNRVVRKVCSRKLVQIAKEALLRRIDVEVDRQIVVDMEQCWYIIDGALQGVKRLQTLVGPTVRLLIDHRIQWFPYYGVATDE